MKNKERQKNITGSDSEQDNFDDDVNEEYDMLEKAGEDSFSEEDSNDSHENDDNFFGNDKLLKKRNNTMAMTQVENDDDESQ